jgi:hypothetical protein
VDVVPSKFVDQEPPGLTARKRVVPHDGPQKGKIQNSVVVEQKTVIEDMS